MIRSQVLERGDRQPDAKTGRLQILQMVETLSWPHQIFGAAVEVLVNKEAVGDRKLTQTNETEEVQHFEQKSSESPDE